MAVSAPAETAITTATVLTVSVIGLMLLADEVGVVVVEGGVRVGVEMEISDLSITCTVLQLLAPVSLNTLYCGSLQHGGFCWVSFV